MRINDKKTLADALGSKLTQISVHAPEIAKRAKPGQFVVVMAKPEGERIPLTVVDTRGNDVTLIFQEIGFSTKVLGTLNQGDSLYAIVGPLGHATEIKKYGKVIVVAGGVGIAEIYPVVRKLKEEGNRTAVVIGARTQSLLFLEKELKSVADELFITTDDGSYGRKGFTTDVLREQLEKEKCDWVYVVGPLPMMRKAALVTETFGVKTMVSLNTCMLDGTGMCGGCRVTVSQKVKFACVDGPEFDAHQIDWDELTKRNKSYESKEKHICQLNLK